MFDIGWTEMLVIAVVMIVVVGPKDLPRMLRTFGKMTTKVRGMAGEFQKQFNDALKEAELDDVKKSVDTLRGLNPTAEIKKQLNPFEKAAADVRAGLDNAMKPKPSTASEAASPTVHEAEPLKNGATDMPGVPGPDATLATPPPGLMTSGIAKPAPATPVGPPEITPVAAAAPSAPAKKPRATSKTAAATAAPVAAVAKPNGKSPVVAAKTVPAASPVKPAAAIAKKPTASGKAPVSVAKPAAKTAAPKPSPAPKAAAATTVAAKTSPRKTK